MIRWGVLLASVALVLTSCNQAATRVSTVWTDVPEIASYVEAFNASQRDWQLLVQYVPNPATRIGQGVTGFDLVVSRWLTAPGIKGSMVSLDSLFNGTKLSRASFYRRILEAGQQGDQSKLLPLAFDLPVVLYSPTQTPDLAGRSITFDELKNYSANSETIAGTETPRAMDFSPRWDGFGVLFLESAGANFHSDFSRGLVWDSSKLTKAMADFRAWPSPGMGQTKAFQQKYLQSDPASTVSAGRIRFYPSTLSTFFGRPWQDRRTLDFRALSAETRWVAADSVIWVGIPSSSQTRSAARHFLEWIFSSATQSQLIKDAQLHDRDAFGFAGGLSSLVSTNDTLAEAFPELGGRLPKADQLSFWGPLPADWTQIKTFILNPWMDDAQGTSATLEALYQKHQAQTVRN